MKTKVEWTVFRIEGSFPGTTYEGPVSKARAEAALRRWRRRYASTSTRFRLVKTTHEEVEG